MRDATYINVGMGYQLNSIVAVGMGFSHRSSNIISHTYTWQTIYDIFSLGANINYQKHDIFLIFSYGFKNRVSGHMPKEIGGGRFTAEKDIVSFSISWGYMY